MIQIIQSDIFIFIIRGRRRSPRGHHHPIVPAQGSLLSPTPDVENDEGDLCEPAEDVERVKGFVGATDHHAVVVGPVGARTRVSQRSVHVVREQGDADGPHQQDGTVRDEVEEWVEEGEGVD